MELPDREICYRALQTRDARFDGLLFVGVTSTGVYCRPVCPARTPNFHYIVLVRMQRGLATRVPILEGVRWLAAGGRDRSSTVRNSVAHARSFWMEPVIRQAEPADRAVIERTCTTRTYATFRALVERQLL